MNSKYCFRRYHRRYRRRNHHLELHRKLLELGLFGWEKRQQGR
jgi:hypothetical protein